MNPIMVDGTGMCGGCRLTVGGKTKFACVDGPDFDGFEVDFDEAMHRGTMYRPFEPTRGKRHATCSKRRLSNMPLIWTRKNAPCPRQDPNVRNKNFKEVALGYTEEMAVNEAKRCLHCKKARLPHRLPCSGIDIPAFIAEVAEGDFEAAYQVIAKSCSLPAVCGRVCPQENQCEGKCVRGIKGEPVGIGRLERFVADWHRENVHTPAAHRPEPNGHKVAVIGAGPAGLTVAGDLAKLGYKVTVYEALHVAGGVLMYGIPEFRLPKAIVQQEVDGLKELGVDVGVQHGHRQGADH